MIFRKGFLYKTFPLKQLDTENVKPSLDERTQFLDIFEQNCNKASINQDQDSSEQDAEETKRFFKTDMRTDFCTGDKIRVVEGELQGATGLIQKLENDQVVFKPTNLEGFEENLGLERSMVVKYFEQGDLVRLIDGKYKGETGMVTMVDQIKGSQDGHPVVKLDKTQREIKVHRNMLRLKTDHDRDMQRLIEMGTKLGLDSH